MKNQALLSGMSEGVANAAAAGCKPGGQEQVSVAAGSSHRDFRGLEGGRTVPAGIQPEYCSV